LGAKWVLPISNRPWAEGGISCEARLLHSGRTTQVWDADVKSEAAGKTIALFRCTQMLLYPRPGA